MDILTLLEQFAANGHFTAIANNPLAQFGTPARRYVGAELLPEMMVPQNTYHEDQIKWRTVIANAGTRYSPAQKKSGDLVGTMLVDLSHSDIKRELDGRQYDALVKMLGSGSDMEAIATLTNWLDTAVNLALVEHNEAMRWQALVNASVVRTGDNGFSETIAYPNPAGHRVVPGASWSTDTTDVFDDIHAQVQVLKNKGYEVSRIITSSAVVAIMAGNNTVKSRVGVAVVNTSGQITAAAGRASLANINGALAADGLPPIETYNLRYRTESATVPFLPAGSMLFVAETGRDQQFDAGDVMLQNTLGYTAVGRGVGMAQPGRVVQAEAKKDKPPRVEAEGWQTTLPVITDPEAIAAITGID